MQAHHEQLYREQMNPWFNNGGHRLTHTQRNLPLGRQVHQLIVEVWKFQDDISFQLVAAPDAFARTQLSEFIRTHLIVQNQRLLDYYGGSEDVLKAMQYKWGLFESDFDDKGIANTDELFRRIYLTWANVHYEIPLKVYDIFNYT